MSIDSKIETTCDHTVRFEEVLIKDDLKTIIIPRVIASPDNVRLYINDYEMISSDPKNGWNIQPIPGVKPFKSKIVLNTARRSQSDYYKVSYICMASYCPKCSGLRIINDESYNSLGLVATVENEPKLLQEVQKGITTVLGSNPFHVWLGTRINALVGAKIFNVEYLKAQLMSEISRYFEKYHDVQTQQGQYQYVSDREAYDQLISIEITQDPVEVSAWTIAIIFQNRTGNNMLFEQKVTIPGPQKLL